MLTSCHGIIAPARRRGRGGDEGGGADEVTDICGAFALFFFKSAHEKTVYVQTDVLNMTEVETGLRQTGSDDLYSFFYHLITF